MRRSVRAAAVAAITAAGLLVAAPTPAFASGSTTLAPGVVLTHRSITFEGHPESIWTVAVDLNAHNHLVSTSPAHKIGHLRENLLYLANQEHAVAGVNGDTLYFVDPTNQPRSGVMYQGRTLKAPIKDQHSVLYTTAANHAYIGPVGFSGTFSTGPNKLKSIQSINSLENAKNGGISMMDDTELSRSSMKTVGNAAAQKITPTCDKVGLLRLGPGRYQVTGLVTKLTSYPQVTPGRYALFSCGTASKQYLESSITVGQTITTSVGYAVHGMVSMISGLRVLIAGGKAYNDPTGLNDLGPYLLPESFACIAANGTHVVLGTVDGRERQSAGMTYAMLQKYLLGQGCYTAMTLSGSTDSQLVAKRPGSALAFQNHLTDKVGNKPNGLVDGLVVTTS